MYNDLNGFTAPDIGFLNTMNQPVRLSRVSMIRELMRIKDDSKNDSELYIVVEHSLNILSKMTDEEYESFDFNEDFDIEIAP